MKPLIFCLAVLAAGAFGSTIVNVSTVVGQTYTVAVTNADTTGASMVGMLITATYANGFSLSCTWTVSGTCANSSQGGGFLVSYPSGTSTSPFNGGGNWTITNTRGPSLSSISIDGLAGMTAFDRCMGLFGGFNDTATSLLSCLGQGTTGSDIGYSLGDASGGTNINANVQYSNQLHLANQPAVGDLWGKVTITFTSPFRVNNTFTFRTDTDTLSSLIIADSPEPGTFGLVGAALVLLGIKLRARNSSTTRS